LAQNQNIKDMNLFKKYKTFDEVLVPFLEGKKIELKAKSLAGYKGRTKVFSEWLEKNNLSSVPLKKISNDDYIRFFHEYLVGERKLDRPTVRKYHEAITSVCRYALDMDELDAMPPFKGLKFPKKGKDCSAQLMPSEALSDLLNDIYENDRQLYVACMLEYYCGVRPKEARFTKAGSFNLKEGVLKIEASVAKTGKQRLVTMADDFIETCKEYGLENVDPNLYVMGKNHSLDVRPVSENMLRYRFNIFRDKHGISKDVKLYTMKHEGASELIKITDLKTIQEHLGHSNITSTAHYVKKISCGVNNNIKVNFHNPRVRVNQP
jgi:integrase